MSSFAGWVTACIPHFRCRRYIRRAVESLLGQTYPWVRVIVINDGDPSPPWDALAGISDRRLVRHSLPTNEGPYFGLEISLRASPDPYFLIQDADDWSVPTRVETLLHAINRHGAVFAVSSQPQIIEEGNSHRVTEVRWQSTSFEPEADDFTVNPVITPYYRYRAPHHGLFRSDALKAIGGYYAGLRISFDTLVPNLILMVGRLCHTRENLYYRLVRRDSLTHSSQTGVSSPTAASELRVKKYIYSICYNSYAMYRCGAIDKAHLTHAIRAACATYISEIQRRSLADETRRLVGSLSSCAAR
jgi:glycosyltransferase involved in cell wall biosynthesis